jgi:hypothetical protein
LTGSVATLRRRTNPFAGATLAAIGLAASLIASPCRANSLEVCDRPAEPSADEKDVMLRFGAVVRQALVASGRDVALIARSGLDLHRLDVRYSHEGVALKDNGTTPWSVRELYYSCDDHKPRVFDEGLAGFLMGTDDPVTSWVSLVLLPAETSLSLRDTATDKGHALGVLGASYSANAYPFSTLHQNCNQWVIELLADAWGAADDAAPGAGDDAASRDAEAGPSSETARTRAQRWLYHQGYRPTEFRVSLHPMLWLADILPWLSNDDHPAAELADNRYSVSMPSSVETFVQAKVPGATRIEICHAGRHVVVHHGWDDIAAGCIAGPGDEVMELARD